MQLEYAMEAPEVSDSISERVRELNQRAISAFLAEMQDVVELCNHALALAAPEGLEHPVDLPGAALALLTLGRMAMAHSDHADCLSYFRQSLELYERHGQLREIALARSYLGAAFANLGDYSRAVETMRQALREAEDAPDTMLAAEIINDLSYTYVLAGEPEMALEDLLRSIEIFRKAGADLPLAWALDSLGQAYLLVGKKEGALACVLEAVSLSERRQNWRDVSRFKQSAGDMYRAVGNLPEALRMYEEELALARLYVLRGDECTALYSIADLLQADGRTSEALPLLNEAFALAVRNGVKPHMRQCCLLLSRVYKHLDDYKNALEYHERFYEIDREIFNAETDQRLRSAQALYQLETARKESELYQLRAQALQLEIEEQRRTEAILAHAASTDSLTDLLNRGAFFDMAEKAFAEAHEKSALLSVILIDIDHFKDVNDKFGHMVGDQALKITAGRLRGSLRSGDLIARYGGEEFIVLLRGIGIGPAMVMAERLRTVVAKEPIHARGVLVPLTLSLGVASFEPGQQPENLDQLVSQADRALYAAKGQGRNAALAYEDVDIR